MKVKRYERVGEQFQKELAILIQQELKDPRISMMTTVTAVEMSPDLSHATCYISVMGARNDQEKTLEGLMQSRGFLRKEIAKKIRLRISPEIHFKLDTSLERGMHMDNLIRQTLLRDEEIRNKSQKIEGN